MNTKYPKISIIIPVFNTEDYIKVCIDSVLNQSYKNIELILVNDGSTDMSGVICNQYQKFDARVKVIHQINSGASTARNIGLDIATGEYIMFLDSDDFWVDNCLAKIVDNLVKKDIDVMFLKSAVIKNDGTLTKFKGYDFKFLNRDELLQYISYQNKVAVSACLKVIKKKLFNDRRLYFKDSLLVEDIDWFFNLINVANKFTTYNGPFYCYRILQNSASRSTSEKRIIDYMYILKKWIEKTSNSEKTIKKYFYYMIGYEYEILIATLYDYNKEIRRKHIKEIEDLFWLLKYRDGHRSKLIKIINRIVGFRATCLLLNIYLHKRIIK